MAAAKKDDRQISLPSIEGGSMYGALKLSELRQGQGPKGDGKHRVSLDHVRDHRRQWVHSRRREPLYADESDAACVIVLSERGERLVCRPDPSDRKKYIVTHLPMHPKEYRFWLPMDERR